jgi:hypothetical protein
MGTTTLTSSVGISFTVHFGANAGARHGRDSHGAIRHTRGTARGPGIAADKVGGALMPRRSRIVR